jgi:hypothetical protein
MQQMRILQKQKTKNVQSAARDISWVSTKTEEPAANAVIPNSRKQHDYWLKLLKTFSICSFNALFDGKEVILITTFPELKTAIVGTFVM